MDVFGDLCVRPGVFYLPGEKVNMETWAMVACDQYTAQKEKWEQADAAVGGAPSALRMIIPEAYLEESDERVPRAQAAMERYLAGGVLERAVEGMVLLRRTTQSGSRLGLVLTVDLEAYDFAPGAQSPVRPTEGTIVARIPPRQKVRRGALLELSHVLLLCDDISRTVIEPVYAQREGLRPLYDTPLLLEGGRAQGWAVEDAGMLAQIAGALRALQEKLPAGGILLAVGDGNHSLATAKAHWMEVKKTLAPAEWETHPARFAMAELNNIYDEALVFEPIHRVVFNEGVRDVLALLEEAGPVPAEGKADAVIVGEAGDMPLKFTRPLHALPVGTVQQLLDRRPDLEVDYVHGEDAVREIAAREKAVGILLPAMDKSLLFPAVAQGGPLPRKTFSMGEANEKRYYMEARKIVKD